jgi:hypothetical protein
MKLNGFRGLVAALVTGVRANGLELLYDLPNSTTADERARIWQFPVQIFLPFGWPAQLLNGPELEARLDGWLKAVERRLVSRQD